MQVTQLDRNDNYALVGGNREGKFSLNATAYTFKVLYDTLYSDKEMAVVRELMANCYDAMKMAGRENEPFNVSMDKLDVSFEDSGPGIPHEKMADIFCTMFGSSKTDDPTQIGGFGLGCKSPFALTDHFTVTSYHNGLQVVYAMHRGDETTGGIPGFREMVRVPCGSRTGLTVTVPLKDTHQRNWIIDKVRHFTKWSGMKVLFKNHKDDEAELLESFDLTAFNKIGFAVFNCYPDHLGGGSVYVSLGNVLYPLSTEIKGYQSLAKNVPNNWCMVIKAEPGKVGVVPSREAISYTQQTTEYLNELVEKWSKNLTGMIDEERYLDLRRVFKSELKGDLRKIFSIYGITTDRRFAKRRKNESTYATGRGGVARMIAEHINSHSSLDEDDVSRLLRKVLPSNMVKRVGAEKRPVSGHFYHHSYNDSRTMLRLAQKMVCVKRLNRIVRGVPGALLYGTNPHGDMLRITKETHISENRGNTIIVSERVKAVQEETYNHRLQTNWAMIVPKLTSELTDRLAKEFARIDLEPIFIRVEKVVPVRVPKTEKVERPKDKYISVVNNHNGYYAKGIQFRIYPLNPATIETPAYYLDIPTRRSKGGQPKGPPMPHSWPSLSNILNALYPGTIVPDSAKDRKFIETKKIPSVVKAMTDELEAYSCKGKDYEIIMALGFDVTIRTNKVSGAAIQIMIPIIKSSVEKLFQTYDIDTVPTDDHRRCLELSRLAWGLKHMSEYHDSAELRSFRGMLYGMFSRISETKGGRLLKSGMPERYNIFDAYSFSQDSKYAAMFEEVLAFINTKFKEGVAA